MLGPRLLSHHNLAMLLDLMTEARDAIERGAWPEFRDRVLSGMSAASAPAPGSV